MVKFKGFPTDKSGEEKAQYFADGMIDLVKRVTKIKWTWYVESVDVKKDHYSAATGDRLQDYDFGPTVGFEKDVFFYYDEIYSGKSINKEFQKEEDFWKFVEKQLKASEETVEYMEDNDYDEGYIKRSPAYQKMTKRVGKFSDFLNL